MFTSLFYIYSRITLDTPANRAGMPNADFSSWTSLETLAKYCLFISISSTFSKLIDWSETHDKIQSGALFEVVTKSGHTEFNPLH